MITEDQKIAFKKVLGHRYTGQVIKTLQAKGVKDTSGKTHSSRMITQVFNGETSHVLIEDAILETVKQKQFEKKKKEEKKKKLLNSIA